MSNQYLPANGTEGIMFFEATAGDRVDIVNKSTDRAAMEDALRAPGLQKIVADAIKRRLKKL